MCRSLTRRYPLSPSFWHWNQHCQGCTFAVLQPGCSQNVSIYLAGRYGCPLRRQFNPLKSTSWLSKINPMFLCLKSQTGAKGTITASTADVCERLSYDSATSAVGALRNGLLRSISSDGYIIAALYPLATDTVEDIGTAKFTAKRSMEI